MYVKDNMTLNPYCINKDTPVSQALDIMSRNNFHRLPVVDEDNCLIGLVTAGLIQENAPSKATSLSIYELNYLLSKTTVSDIMIRDVITIKADVFLEEAANTMRENNIGCLVVTDNNKVTGIITHNDIFKAFTNLLGYNEEGTRYIIKMEEDKPGMFKKVVDVIAEMDVNISNIAVYHTVRGIEVVLVTNGENSDKCREHLEEQGYVITDMIQTQKKD